MSDLLDLAVGISHELAGLEFLNERACWLFVNRTSRQDMRCRFGQDLPAKLWLEAGDNGQFLLNTAHLIDRQPETVGVPQLRLAVVLLQCLRGEEELVNGVLS